MRRALWPAVITSSATVPRLPDTDQCSTHARRSADREISWSFQSPLVRLKRPGAGIQLALGWASSASGALRRLRIVGGIGIVLGYSRDEPASGERLQVHLQRVSNLLGIDLPVVRVDCKGSQILFLLRRILDRRLCPLVEWIVFGACSSAAAIYSAKASNWDFSVARCSARISNSGASAGTQSFPRTDSAIAELFTSNLT